VVSVQHAFGAYAAAVQTSQVDAIREDLRREQEQTQRLKQQLSAATSEAASARGDAAAWQRQYEELRVRAHANGV
jgi:uncharacterized protein YlxW (UPF0749 family)